MERQEFTSTLNFVAKMPSEEFVERHSQGNRRTQVFRPVDSEHQKVSLCGHEKVYKHSHDSRGSQCFRC